MKARFPLALVLLVTGCAGSHEPTIVTGAFTPPLRVRYTAIVSAATAKAMFPNINVTAAAADGAGGWYVVGNGLMGVLHANGRIAPNWHARFLPCGLARSGARLYVPLHGGRVAAYATRSGARLWLSPRLWRRNPYGCIGAPIVARGRMIYVGTATRRPRMVALDAATGRPLTWKAEIPHRWTAVTALALGRGRLYVGGSGGLIALDPASGKRLPWHTTELGSEVDTILPTHGMLFISGFDTEDVLSERTGRVVPLTHRASANVYAVDGDLLYTGGDLRMGNAVRPGPDHNLGAFDLATRKATPWAPRLDNYVNVARIVPSGRNVLVLGAFENTIG